MVTHQEHASTQTRYYTWQYHTVDLVKFMSYAKQNTSFECMIRRLRYGINYYGYIKYIFRLRKKEQLLSDSSI